MGFLHCIKAFESFPHHHAEKLFKCRLGSEMNSAAGFKGCDQQHQIQLESSP